LCQIDAAIAQPPKGTHKNISVASDISKTRTTKAYPDSFEDELKGDFAKKLYNF